MAGWDDALEHHVARMLRIDLDEVEIDPGPPGWWRVGTLPVPVDVRIDGDDRRLVRVQAEALQGVKRSYRLLRELNDHNTFLDHVRTWWEDTSVFVGAELLIASLEPGELGEVVSAVARTTGALAELLPVVLSQASPVEQQNLFFPTD